MKLKPWRANIDPTTIPDDVLATERGRRNALKRRSYTGGVIWAQHSPETKGCRCQSCITVREHKAADAAQGRDWDSRQGCGCGACRTARKAAA